MARHTRVISSAQSFDNSGLIRGAGLFNRGLHDIDRIITERGKRGRVLVVEGTITVDEAGNLLVRIANEVMTGEVAIIHNRSILTQGSQNAIPTVAAEHRTCKADLTGLVCDQGHLLVIIREHDHIRTGCVDLGQLRLKIGIVRTITLVADNLKPQLLRLGNKCLGNTVGVVVGGVRHDGDLFRAKLFSRKLRHNLALEWVQEAGAENIVPILGNRRGCTGRSEHRRTVAGRNFRYSVARLRSNVADQKYHSVADQLVVAVDSVLNLALFILGQKFNLAAHNAAVGVDLVDCHFDAVGG